MFPFINIQDKNFTMFNHDLLIDLNFIDSVFFVKSKDKHNYIQNSFNNKTMEIIVNENIKFKNKKLGVPTGFDEDILYILIYLAMKFKEKHKLTIFPQGFLFTYVDIKNLLQETKNLFTNNDNIDLSLLRLRHTVYNLTESFLKRDGSKLTTSDFDKALSQKLITETEYEEFYNNLDNVPEEIIAKLSTINPVSKIKIKSSINLLNELTEIEIKDISKSGIESFVNSNIIDNFLGGLHGLVNKFFYVKFSDTIYNNLVGKVTISRSLFYLLSLDSIERTVLNYALLNQGKYIVSEKKIKKSFDDNIEDTIYFVDKFHRSNYINKNEVILGLYTILNKIPLDTSTKNLSRSINKIIQSLDYLQNHGYIQKYFYFDEKPKGNMKFKIIFFDHQSSYNKIGKYFDSRFTTSEEVNNNLFLTDKQLLDLNKNDLVYDSQLFNIVNNGISNGEKNIGAEKNIIGSNIDLLSTQNSEYESNDIILLDCIEHIKKIFSKVFRIDLSVTTIGKINLKLKSFIGVEAYFNNKKLKKLKHQYFLDFITDSFTLSMKNKIKNPEGLLCSYLNNIDDRLDEYLYAVAQGLISDIGENIDLITLSSKQSVSVDNKKFDTDINNIYSLDYVLELKQYIKLDKALLLDNVEFIASKFISDNKKLIESGFSLDLVLYIIEARVLGKLDFKKIPMFFAALFSKLNI